MISPLPLPLVYALFPEQDLLSEPKTIKYTVMNISIPVELRESKRNWVYYPPQAISYDVCLSLVNCSSQKHCSNASYRAGREAQKGNLTRQTIGLCREYRLLFVDLEGWFGFKGKWQHQGLTTQAIANGKGGVCLIV